MVRKAPDLCMLCDQSPCACETVKPKRAKTEPKPKKTVPAPPAQPVVTPFEQPADTPFVAPERRLPRRITAPPPPEFTVAKPVTPVVTAPAIKKVERHLSTNEVVEIVAIQNFYKAGLLDIQLNRHLAHLVTVTLTPAERAVAWKAMQ